MNVLHFAFLTAEPTKIRPNKIVGNFSLVRICVCVCVFIARCNVMSDGTKTDFQINKQKQFRGKKIDLK